MDYTDKFRQSDLPIRPSKDDFRTLVDLKNFDYVISKPKCSFRKDTSHGIELPYFVIFVNSLAENVGRRNVIRDTWAHFDSRCKTYFLLGAVESPELQAQIAGEDAEYNDIIQGNFLDSPRNPTYKHVMALKWYTYNCARAKYMVKMNDDVFINIPSVFEFLVNNNQAKDFLLGSYRSPFTPAREGKYALTEEEYPPMYLPTFADASAVIYSNDVAIRMYLKSKRSKFVRLDDVFVAGLLRIQLNVGITDNGNHLLPETSLNNLRLNPLAIPDNFLFSNQSVSESDQRLLWGKTEWSRLNINIKV